MQQQNVQQTHLLPPLSQPPRSLTPPSPNKQHHSTTAAAATAAATMAAAAAGGNYFGGGYHTSPPPLVGGQFMGHSNANPILNGCGASGSIKYGTLIPNRVFVGGISNTTTEADLHKLFSEYGNVRATKIISDRGGASKGYGFVTFETEEEAKKLQDEADNIVLKERKLNIAPAIKKTPYPRPYDMGQPSMNGGGGGGSGASGNGTVYYHNGVPYTYQNGVAVFHSPEAAAAAAAAAAIAAANPA